MKLLEKKVAILASDLNQLIWRGFKLREHVQTRLGVKDHSTVYRWINGISKPSSKNLKLVVKNLRELDFEWPLRPIEFEDMADEVGIHNFAALFGLDRAVCNRIVDETIFKNRHLIPFFYFGSSAATDFMESLGGIYHLYRRGLAAQDYDTINMIAVHVRYPIRTGSDECAIRCKLNLSSGQNILEYDGFVGAMSGNLYWVFEQRGGIEPERDGIVMITDLGSERLHRREIMGQYVSMIHERISTPAARPLVMDRVEIDPNPDRATQLELLEHCLRSPPSVPEWVRKRLNFEEES